MAILNSALLDREAGGMQRMCGTCSLLQRGTTDRRKYSQACAVSDEERRAQVRSNATRGTPPGGVQFTGGWYMAIPPNGGTSGF